ncbi:MAG: cytochrome c biogenesis protein ResB [Coriobacteriia bacterium]|nr:cytochrome c biogenesis protein ResB [Coriobacteriia bacterium]
MSRAGSTPLSKVTNWLASPRLAVVLLFVAGVWSFVGTLVPQGAADNARVVEWAAANPGLTQIVSTLGLHRTFVSPIFIALMALLAASTAVCSWRRTKVAIRRHRLLRGLDPADAERLVARPTFVVDDAPTPADDTRQAVSGALRRLGLSVQPQRGELTVAGSRPWVAFGSPVFHWSLFLLIVVILGASLWRLEGLIGVPVGESRPLAKDAFGLLTTGRLYRFPASPLQIRVDKMDMSYPIDGIDRGPAPTVSVLAPDGSVVASQVVFPNKPLRHKSLIVHSSEIGLAPRFALVSKETSEVGRTTLIVDFDEKSPGGTAPAQFVLESANPEDSLEAAVSVPLDVYRGEQVQGVPKVPKASFVIRRQSDTSLAASGTIGIGEDLALPDGSTLQLVGVGYYARLSVVDDSSVPVVYLLLTVALIGVTVSILGRQSLAVVSIGASETDGTAVRVWFRDWRGGAVRAEQAEEFVREALGSAVTDDDEQEHSA